MRPPKSLRMAQMQAATRMVWVDAAVNGYLHTFEYNGAQNVRALYPAIMSNASMVKSFTLHLAPDCSLNPKP